MYANPHEVITQVCPGCGIEFDSPRYFNKLYCTALCRRRTKHQRERARALEVTPVPTKNVADERFFITLENPTQIQLDKYADLIGEGLVDKPIRLYNFSIGWTAPLGVELIKQQKMTEHDQDTWLLQKRELSPLDAMLT